MLQSFLPYGRPCAAVLQVIATVAQYGPDADAFSALICACEAAGRPKLAQELLQLLQLQQVALQAAPAAALIRLLTQQPSQGLKPVLAASSELELVQVRLSVYH